MQNFQDKCTSNLTEAQETWRIEGSVKSAKKKLGKRKHQIFACKDINGALTNNV